MQLMSKKGVAFASGSLQLVDFVVFNNRFSVIIKLAFLLNIFNIYSICKKDFNV